MKFLHRELLAFEHPPRYGSRCGEHPNGYWQNSAQSPSVEVSDFKSKAELQEYSSVALDWLIFGYLRLMIIASKRWISLIIPTPMLLLQKCTTATLHPCCFIPAPSALTPKALPDLSGNSNFKESSTKWPMHYIIRSPPLVQTSTNAKHFLNAFSHLLLTIFFQIITRQPSKKHPFLPSFLNQSAAWRVKEGRGRDWMWRWSLLNSRYDSGDLAESNVSNITVIGFVEDGVLEDLLQLFLRLMKAEGRIAPHEIVQIHHSPLPKPVLSQPLNQRLQLVAGLQVRGCHHFVLNHHQVLIGVELLRYWQFRHCQPERRLDHHQQPHQHLFIAFVNGLVCLWIREALVIISQVKWSVSDEPELFIFSVAMVMRRWLIFAADDGKSTDHHCIDNAAALLHLLQKFLLFCYLHLIPLFLSSLQRSQYIFLESCFPVLIHKRRVLVDDGIKGCFIYLEEIIGDGGWVDAVVAHDSFWHVSERLVIGLSVDAAECEGQFYLFGQLHPQELMAFPQPLHTIFQLFTDYFSFYNSVDRVHSSLWITWLAYLRNYVIKLLPALCYLLQLTLFAEAEVKHWQRDPTPAAMEQQGYNFPVDHLQFIIGQQWQCHHSSGFLFSSSESGSSQSGGSLGLGS